MRYSTAYSHDLRAVDSRVADAPSTADAPSAPHHQSLLTEGGRALLELEAMNKKTADEFALAITEAAAEDRQERGPVNAKSMAARKAHNVKREMEVSSRKRAAEARKAKYMDKAGGGMKYTALAMANRPDD